MIQFPHFIFHYITYLLAPCLVGIFVALAFVMRNEVMRKWIVRELKNEFGTRFPKVFV